MPYATLQDLTDLLGEREFATVADRDGCGSVDVAAVEKALADASSMADSYISRWLPLPDPVPDVVKRHVMWIAVYDLAGNVQTDDQRRRYEDAERWLRDVAAGRASIGIPPTNPASQDGAVTSFSTPRAMTRRSLAGCL